MSRRPSRWALLYRGPLAVLSFVFYRVFRWVMRRVANGFFALNRKQALRWRPLCAASLRNPLAMPILMTSAPRWNPHAVIATAGPLPVRASLSVDVAAARRSAAAWSVVIYTFPGFRTVSTLDARDPVTADEATVTLPPGRYWLGLRYYHWRDDAVLPAVRLDGVAVVAATAVPPDVNGFYESLSRRRSVFYFFLHYYVWVVLRYSGNPPGRFVEREYVPVGNPGTQFLFGVVERSQCVRIGVTPDDLRTHDIFLTIYSRYGVPMFWGPVTQADFRSAVCARPGHYLLRVQPRAAGTGVSSAPELTIGLEDGLPSLKA